MSTFYISNPLSDFHGIFFNFALGKMTVEEIGEDFTQDDLISDDVMILDGGSNIFVWIGKGSNADERKHAPE